ncbi:acid phosphatase (plasmid) [Arthrobacter sp. Hiyo8]|nr:acid phosphatase [Arthrobacter sp. Hiyo8]
MGWFVTAAGKRPRPSARVRHWVGKHRMLAAVATVVVAALVAAGVTFGIATARFSSNAPALAGINKIQHVIVIMQENRSFDSYFGTFPGADGIPMLNGSPAVCVRIRPTARA